MRITLNESEWWHHCFVLQCMLVGNVALAVGELTSLYTELG